MMQLKNVVISIICLISFNVNAENWIDQSKVDKFTQQFAPRAIANFVDTDLPNIILQGELTCGEKSSGSQIQPILKLSAFTKKDNGALRYKVISSLLNIEIVQV